jgi:Mce-associated membrane protein
MTNSPAKVEPDDGDAAHSAGADAQPPSPEKTSKSPSGCEAAVAPECLDRDDVASIADRRGTFVRMLGFWLLPSIALLLALGAAYFKYQEGTASDEDRARVETVQVATEATVAMLSYTPETAAEKLKAARDRLTGPFRGSYTSLTEDVVIPGAQQKRISATARVSAAASVSAGKNRAIVLVFVDQTTTVGNDAPTETDSVVQVSLDKVGSRWLISGFEPK